MADQSFYSFFLTKKTIFKFPFLDLPTILKIVSRRTEFDFGDLDVLCAKHAEQASIINIALEFLERHFFSEQ